MQRLDQLDGLYHLDPAHSALGFTVRHAGLSRIRGSFDSFHGYAIIDADDVDNSALMVSISSASINTFVADRDAHLRSGDFFDVATYPAITFVGVGFRIIDEQHVEVSGDLTVRDVTRGLNLVFEYTGSATDPFGNQRVGFEAQTRISRKDYGLTWNAALETGGWLVSDEIVLDIEASAVRQAAQESGDLPLVVTGDELADVAMTPDAEMVAAELAASGVEAEPAEAPGASAQGKLAHGVPDAADSSRAAAASHALRGEAAPVGRVRPRRALDGDEDVAAETGRGGWWRRIAGN